MSALIREQSLLGAGVHIIRLPMVLKLGRHMRVVAFWAMLVPFALLSLIGQSVMPVRAADGVIMLVICTGNGMVEKAFDAVTMEPVDETGKSDRKKPETTYCAWAASQPTIALPSLAVLAQPRPMVPGADLWWADTILKFAAATGLPPATGPPHLV